MGKRSAFAHRPRDLWPTPTPAVLPLLRYLPRRVRFIEPCAGEGYLAKELIAAGHICADAFDILPQGFGRHFNAFDWFRAPAVPYPAVTIITNPPWTRELLHPMILHLTAQHPTILLFDADWLHTIQAAPFLPLLTKVVSVGRVKWITDSPSTGKDNCAWYFFNTFAQAPAQIVGRQAAKGG